MKIAPAVSFTGAPAGAAYQSTFTVASTTNAGSAATVTASDACSIAGNTVTMTSGTGTCGLTANWAADSNYLAASASQSTTAARVASTTTTTSRTPNPSTFGQPVTFTATVSSGAGVPAGTVTFMDGVTTLGTGILNGSGQAAFATTALFAGSHTITALYSGDTNFDASTSFLGCAL